MEYQHIRFSIESGVARLTLHRPDKLNSLNVAMHLELQDALLQVTTAGAPARDVTGHESALRQSGTRGGRVPESLHPGPGAALGPAPDNAPARVLLLTGAGRGFCAGQDLGDRAVSADGSARVDLGESIERYYAPLVRMLHEMPLPVVCAVNGVAAGAGANIALVCDIVLAARSASFYEPFCKLGLVPDSGGTYFLPRLIGTARALGMALLGDKIGAEQAEAWGLIWKALPDEELMPAAEKLAVQLAQAPTRGLAATKQAIYAGGTLEQQLALERDLQRELGRTYDYREGVAAFLERRAPRFEGR